MGLLPALSAFLRATAPLEAGDALLVAFSGGPDSTALLWGLGQVAPGMRLRLVAAHLDHGLDPGSPQRARQAAQLAARLGVPLTSGRAAQPGDTHRGESREAAARRCRYRFLRARAADLGARYIVTAHHADDQAETLLLRLLFGSGLEGLRCIRSRHGDLLRPLLDLRRNRLERVLSRLGIDPVIDPTNLDLATPRNRLRHTLLPALTERDPEIVPRLCRLAAAADRASQRIAATLRRHLRPAPDREGRPSVDRPALAALPVALLPAALSLLHRSAGAPYPPPAGARSELRRQLREGRRIGCDSGGGWRLEEHGDRIVCVRRPAEAPRFTYTEMESSPAPTG